MDSGLMGILKAVLKAILIVASFVLNFIFPPRLVIERRKIIIPSLSLSLNRSVKIVQLSDFHLDTVLPDKISTTMLSTAVDAANAEDADLILLTGDYVDKDPTAVYKIIPFLKKLRAKFGVFAVLGNHDYKGGYKGRTEIVRVLEQDCGIRVLVGDTVRPFVDAQNFEIIGLGDMSSREDFKIEEAFKDAKSPKDEQNITRIVLSHNPDTFVKFLKWKVDLQLSGHTHGGQICYPNGVPVLRHIRMIYDAIPNSLSFLKKIFPIHVHAIRNWDYAYGFHLLTRDDGGDNRLYVSRGLGTHPPCRINCPCEVNILELSPS